MKITLVFILLSVTALTACKRKQAELTEMQKLIIRIYDHPDWNPLHQNETQEIQEKFFDILKSRNQPGFEKQNQEEMNTLFRWIYENSDLYEDSPDFRRQRTRRALCFASLALISDYDELAYTMLNYAKFSIFDDCSSPDTDKLEHQLIGLYLIEVMIRAENQFLYNWNLDELEDFILTNQKKIDQGIFDDVMKQILLHREMTQEDR